MRETLGLRLRIPGRLAVFVLAVVFVSVPLSPAAPGEGTKHPLPNVLFVTIDTLRTDRVTAYGYDRPTTPNLDRLILAGTRFTQARTIEPLTSPALCSMLTSVYPHAHGSTRNGLRMRSGLASLPKALQGRGYRTAAFVGNWTLREKLSGLAEHFERYDEVMSRRRWLGLIRGEATAEDISERAMDWISAHERKSGEHPFFVWVHYVEPHAPYRLHREYAERLGLPRRGNVGPADRYDTEIAFVDESIGDLLRGIDKLGLTEDTLIVFASDHGESLGEHKYWGHGRHLYEPTLRIPMSITWPGRVPAGEVTAPALITDLAPTVLGLLDQRQPSSFTGFDWTGVLHGESPPASRPTHYQAHKGAVISRHDSDLARRTGLLEVGVIRGNRKEIFRVKSNRSWVFDLDADPLELSSLRQPKDPPSEGLLDWMRSVYASLAVLDDDKPEPLDEESIRQLRSLGYVD